MIPDYRIKGQPVSAQEIEDAPPLDVRIVVPVAGRPTEGKSATWARDQMIERLIQPDDFTRPMSANQAREIADRTATMHDRRRR